MVIKSLIKSLSKLNIMQFYNIIMIHVQSLKIQTIKEKKEKKHKNQLPIMVIIHNVLN